MLSKIQTDTHLSGRLLDQGTRSGSATNRVSSNLCALHSTSSAYHSSPLPSRANRRIFNRLECSANLPRRLANFLRISKVDTPVNRALRFLLTAQPDPFISLRGSKEPKGHPARAKTARQPTHSHSATKLKITKRPFSRGALSSFANSKTHRQRVRLRLPSTAVAWV